MSVCGESHTEWRLYPITDEMWQPLLPLSLCVLSIKVDWLVVTEMRMRRPEVGCKRFSSLSLSHRFQSPTSASLVTCLHSFFALPLLCFRPRWVLIGLLDFCMTEGREGREVVRCLFGLDGVCKVR